MEQITSRVLRNVEWKPVYFYPGEGSFSFTVFASDKLPGLTITKERRGKRKVNTIYKFEGRRTDSPTQIVRYWNEHVKASKTGRSTKPGEPSERDAADGLEPVGRPKPRKGTGV